MALTRGSGGLKFPPWLFKQLALSGGCGFKQAVRKISKRELAMHYFRSHWVARLRCVGSSKASGSNSVQSAQRGGQEVWKQILTGTDMGCLSGRH